MGISFEVYTIMIIYRRYAGAVCFGARRCAVFKESADAASWDEKVQAVRGGYMCEPPFGNHHRFSRYAY